MHDVIWRKGKRGGLTWQEFESGRPSAGEVLAHWFGGPTFAIKNAKGEVVWIDPDETVARLSALACPVAGVLVTRMRPAVSTAAFLRTVSEAWPGLSVHAPVDAADMLRQTGLSLCRIMTARAGRAFCMGGNRVMPVFAWPPKGAPEHGIPASPVENLGYVVHTGGRHRIYVSGNLIPVFARLPVLVNTVAAQMPTVGLLSMDRIEGEPFWTEWIRRSARLLGLEQALWEEDGWLECEGSLETPDAGSSDGLRLAPGRGLLLP